LVTTELGGEEIDSYGSGALTIDDRSRRVVVPNHHFKIFAEKWCSRECLVPRDKFLSLDIKVHEIFVQISNDLDIGIDYLVDLQCRDASAVDGTTHRCDDLSADTE